MFRFAVHRGWIEHNPAADVEAPGKENKKDRALNDDEIKVVWAELEGAPISPSLQMAVKLLLLTGQRPGEVAGARWDEFDLVTRWWTLTPQRTKNGRAHRVFLSELVMDLLDQVRRLSPFSQWIFPSPRGNKPIATTSIAHAIKRSNFPDVKAFTARDLRRSCATGMARIGISEFTIGLLLNHSRARGITSRYNVYRYDAEKRAALTTWSNHVEALLSDTEQPTNVVPLR